MLVIRTMISQNDFQTKQAEQGGKHARTDIVYMHDTRTKKQCYMQRAQKSMQYRLETFMRVEGKSMYRMFGYCTLEYSLMYGLRRYTQIRKSFMRGYNDSQCLSTPPCIPGIPRVPIIAIFINPNKCLYRARYAICF